MAGGMRGHDLSCTFSHRIAVDADVKLSVLIAYLIPYGHEFAVSIEVIGFSSFEHRWLWLLPSGVKELQDMKLLDGLTVIPTEE